MSYSGTKGFRQNHFYPFGLTMAGISSKAVGKTENKYKFNDGTELNSSFEIGLYETDFRLYDPQIGRFAQPDEFSEAFEDWSPYTFANDNPILLNDPSGLSSDTGWKDLKEVVVKAKKLKELDSENGQVLPPQSALSRFLWGNTREWNGLWVKPSGYLFFSPDGKPVEALIEFSVPDIGKKSLVKKASGVVGKYLVYRAYKKVKGRLKLYIGKAKGSLSKRYTKKELDDIAARVIERLDDLPDNATALGVEQAILDLNGGIAATANIKNAAVKEVYVQAGLKWLETNIPNWRDVFIFK